MDTDKSLESSSRPWASLRQQEDTIDVRMRQLCDQRYTEQNEDMEELARRSV